MRNHFTCSNCQSKQKIKHLLFVTNYSNWNCHKCKTKLKPERKTNFAIIIGFLGGLVGAIPAYYSIFILKYSLIKSLFIGLLFGFFLYIGIIIYYYYNLDLKESE